MTNRRRFLLQGIKISIPITLEVELDENQNLVGRGHPDFFKIKGEWLDDCKIDLINSARNDELKMGDPYISTGIESWTVMETTKSGGGSWSGIDMEKHERDLLEKALGSNPFLQKVIDKIKEKEE